MKMLRALAALTIALLLSHCAKIEVKPGSTGTLFSATDFACTAELGQLQGTSVTLTVSASHGAAPYTIESVDMQGVDTTTFQQAAPFDHSLTFRALLPATGPDALTYGYVVILDAQGNETSCSPFNDDPPGLTEVGWTLIDSSDPSLTITDTSAFVYNFFDDGSGKIYGLHSGTIDANPMSTFTYSLMSSDDGLTGTMRLTLGTTNKTFTFELGNALFMTDYATGYTYSFVPFTP